MIGKVIKLRDLVKASSLLEVGIPKTLTFGEKQVINTIQHCSYVGQNFFGDKEPKWRQRMESRWADIEEKLALL